MKPIDRGGKLGLADRCGVGRTEGKWELDGGWVLEERIGRGRKMVWIGLDWIGLVFVLVLEEVVVNQSIAGPVGE